MLKEILEEVRSVNGHSAFVTKNKETFHIVKDNNVAMYGPFDEKSEKLIIARYERMRGNGSFKGGKLIKTKDNFPNELRDYKFKDVTLVQEY